MKRISPEEFLECVDLMVEAEAEEETKTKKEEVR